MERLPIGRDGEDLEGEVTRFEHTQTFPPPPPGWTMQSTPSSPIIVMKDGAEAAGKAAAMVFGASTYIGMCSFQAWGRWKDAHRADFRDFDVTLCIRAHLCDV